MLESAAVRALLLSLAAGLSTLLGALVVFAARRRSEKLLAVSLGFAGGVMLAVSFTDLFPTAREHLTASLGGRPGALAAVLSLPEKYRLPVHLFYYEGYSIAETAAVLGRRESTVRAQLTRARAMLREKLEVECI